jgi:hypothetical protein
MMIWQDKISDILDMVNGQSFFNVNTNTAPANLGLKIINMAKDWLCMYKPWRDLLVLYQATFNPATRVMTLPDDYGQIVEVYTDPSNIGKPMWVYTLRDNDVAKRYDEQGTYTPAAGFVRQLEWPPTVFIPQNPWIRYSKVLADYAGPPTVEISFFPITVMLVVCKKFLQDFYGVPANQDPKWIQQRVMEEIRVLEGYAYQNNTSMDPAIKDMFGNPIRILGASMDGSQQRMTSPSPFLPSTFYTGGSM